MTLRTKFAMVLLLLTGTLCVNVGVSVWGLRFLQRELAWPLESIQSVMSGLQSIKRTGEDQGLLVGTMTRPTRVGGEMTGDPAGSRFEVLSVAIEAELTALDSVPTYLTRSGITTTRNIRDRSDEIDRIAARWFTDGQSEDRVALAEAVWARHELIERVEARIISDAALAVGHAERTRVLVLVIIAVSVLGAASVAFLMTLLVRRWVLVPVGELRAGAERLGRGELDHRIGVATDDELGRLSREFNQMAGLLKAMQDERVERERLAAMGEMARRIVHNLRTPLAGIRSLAEVTKSDLPAGSDLIEVQDRVIRSVDRFEGWLRDMLRASSPIDLHPQSFDPRALIRGVGESHRDAGAGRGVRVVVDAGDLPETVYGDAHHLEHALTALVSNALEYAPEGSEVLVAGRAEEGYWIVRVTDSGCGVPIGLQQEIFRPYFTTRQGGTGIGLALVKRVAEQHGGAVTVESPVNRDSGSGTAFELRLPLDAGVG